jgi:hypothetical protein
MLERMVSSVFTICTYNILFFGIAQLLSLGQNPTPAFPEAYTSSAFTGLMLGFMVFAVILAKYAKHIWTSCRELESR